MEYVSFETHGIKKDTILSFLRRRGIIDGKEGIPVADNKFSRSMTNACVPMTTLQSIIGGKWKILIIWYIHAYSVQRFGELQRRIGPAITKSTLTRQLRELEQDGWIHRHVFPEVPPRVEYTLTGLGNSFVPILEAMKDWSESHLCGVPDLPRPENEKP